MSARTGMCWWVGLGLLLLGGGGAADPGSQATPAEFLAGSAVRTPQGIQFTLSADQELVYDIFRLSNPYRLVLDVVGARKPIQVKAPSGDPFLTSLRYSLWKDDPAEPIVRYVFETSCRAGYHIVGENGRLNVWLAGESYEQAALATPAHEFPGAELEAVAVAAAPIPDVRPAPLPMISNVSAPKPPSGRAGPFMSASSKAPEGSMGPLLVPMSSTHEPIIREAAGPKGMELSDLLALADTWEASGRLSAWEDPRIECAELWGDALVVSLPEEPERAPEKFEPEPAELSERVALAEPVPLASEPAVLAREPVAEESEALAERDPVPIAGVLEPLPEAEPMVAEKLDSNDPFAELVARYQAAAQERAARDWSKESPRHDRAPLLGSTDPDFSPALSGNLPPMSLDVQGADIQTVIRSIAEYSGVNIVADNNVKGIVTLRALDLPWPKMLATVCRSLGLVAVDHGNVVRVATAKTAQEEALERESAARKREDVMAKETRIVKLHYANAEELTDVIDGMRGPDGRVKVDTRTNSMVLTDIPPRLELLEEILRGLDSETLQIEITAEIVDIDVTASRELGISWGLTNLHSSSLNASGSVEQASGVAITDPAPTLKVGVLRSFGELKAQIDALVTNNHADIISTPRITTVNNREARILVGKEVPLITMDQAGNAITELKKVGITLAVTPYVNSENEITLDLHPEISDLSSQATVQGGIVFNTTEADTRVMVRNGETAVIGGLIRTAKTEFERGVPYLKDVPFLGELFKSTETDEESRELLIFVTPKIVRADNL